MKKIANISLSIALLSMISIPTFSMQWASRTAGKYGMEYAKKVISKSFTAAHWGISTGPFIVQGLFRIGSSIFDKAICDRISAADSGISRYETDLDGNKKPIYRNKYLETADISVQEFAHEQARKIGLDTMPSIRTLYHSPSTMAAVQNVILIDYKYDSELKIALKTNEKGKLHEAGGILQHECTHIKNQDQLTLGAECFVTPFLTHQLSKTVSIAMPFAQKIVPFWLQQGLKLSSAVGKYALNSAILSASSRRKEQRADDGIYDDIETLQAMNNSFTKMQEEYKSYDQEKYTSYDTYFKEKFPTLNYYLFASHPTIDDRIAKFNKRIEKLKNETHL